MESRTQTITYFCKITDINKNLLFYKKKKMPIYQYLERTK